GGVIREEFLGHACRQTAPSRFIATPFPLCYFLKQKRLPCRRQFPAGWSAKRPRYTSGWIRHGFHRTSQSSWTATAAGRANATCREWPDIAPELRLCATWSKPHRALLFLRSRSTRFLKKTGS